MAAAAFTSCGDSFLDEELYSSYGAGVKDINAKIVGLHRQFAAIGGWSDRQGFVGCWQDGTDVGAPGSTEGVEVPFYQYADLNSENRGVSYYWEALYDIIGSANIVINDANVDAASKAEAEFFRAYAYNQLVTLWGPVPLLTENQASPRTNYTRNPVAEVDAVIKADLQDAIANLPEVDKTVTESRINKDCARMLAADAYLRMGLPAEAEAVITPTIEGGNYKLIEKRYGKFTSEAGDYYSDMFRWGNERRSQGNTEGIWIFQMEYERDVVGGTIGAPQQRRNWVAAFHKINGMQNADSLGGRGNGRLRLSNYVKYYVFGKGDIRNSNHNIRRQLWYNKPGFSATLNVDAEGFVVDAGTPGSTEITVKTGDLAHWRRSDTLEVMYPHTTKWGGYDTTDDFGWALIKDWPVMRLAEAYLFRAEARIKQGKTSEAAADINVLRDRAFKEYREKTGNADAGKVTAADMTIDFLLDERIREMVGEENRRYTLVRTGKLAERVKYMQQIETAPANKIITGFDEKKHVLLPIPLSEIQLNKDANLEQNPGY
ncbi:MAG: RagB/SusD family nutrient uptake outer membrane protein [Bacteroidales bacterium]|nr:RagB/SusD family nutrient uptake outer membrane protein [Bacteroidales bacterium]